MGHEPGHAAGEVELLNLGSGIRVSTAPSAVNIDWSPYLRIAGKPVLRRVAPLLLGKKRRERLATVPDNILVHDLRKGIPFPDRSVGAVYHSHVLEHIDRDAAEGFMEEVHRVLRPGHIQRIVVPDLEYLIERYSESLSRADAGGSPRSHDQAVAAILEQSVRREGAGVAGKPKVARLAENLLLGGARRRGETHQWMYDRINLADLLAQSGFTQVRQKSFRTSDIPGWEWLGQGLDTNPDGSEYKEFSLYIEAVRP